MIFLRQLVRIYFLTNLFEYEFNSFKLKILQTTFSFQMEIYYNLKIVVHKYFLQKWLFCCVQNERKSNFVLERKFLPSHFYSHNRTLVFKYLNIGYTVFSWPGHQLFVWKQSTSEMIYCNLIISFCIHLGMKCSLGTIVLKARPHWM